MVWQEIDAVEAAIDQLRETRQGLKKEFDEQVCFILEVIAICLNESKSICIQWGSGNPKVEDGIAWK